MKKIAWLLVLAIILGCGAALAEAEYTAYNHNEAGYTVEYPVNWMALDADEYYELLTLIGYDAETAESVVAPNRLQKTIMFFADDGGDNINIGVSQAQVNYNDELLVKTVESVDQMMRSLFEGYEMVDEVTTYKANGLTFAWFSCMYLNEGQPMVAVQATTYSGKNMYCITLTLAGENGDFTQEYFNQRLTIMQNMMDSFKVTK